MGSRGGPLWQRITYKLPPPPQPPTPHPHQPPSASSPHQISSATDTQQSPCGTLTLEDAQGQISSQQASLWDYLKQQLQAYRVQPDGGTTEQLPFDFCGGLVGYLGYELKAELGGQNAHQAATPDAAMFLSDR